MTALELKRKKAAEAAARYRARHPDRVKASIEKRKDKANEYVRNYRLRQGDKVRATEAKYRTKSKHVNAAKASKRRAILRNACPKWLNDIQKDQIKQMFKNRPEGYHVDHIVPLAGKEVCGLHVPWNLQYLKSTENSKKHNKLVL